MADLARKLGIKAGDRIAFVNYPAEFTELLGALPEDVRHFERASEPLDVIVYFSDTKANVEGRVPLLVPHLAEGARLWLGYPAPDSSIDTDSSRAAVIAIASHNELQMVEEIEMNREWHLVGFRKSVGLAPSRDRRANA